MAEQTTQRSSVGGSRRRAAAWMLIVIADAGFGVWGAMAAVWPDRLLGPDGKPILAAGYEGFSQSSWTQLTSMAPLTAGYISLLFRMYGVFNAVFGLMSSAIAATAFRRGHAWAWWTLLIGNTVAFGSAMAYDWTVNAIGPFELLEYVGLGMVYGALAVTVTRPGPDRLPHALG